MTDDLSNPLACDLNAARRESSAGELIFVADAGGTKTTARIVALQSLGAYRILGESVNSAGNPLSVGFEAATRSMEDSLRQLRAQANLDGSRQLDRAVMSIAGAANHEIAAQFVGWACQMRLARSVAVVSDVLPVLAAGTSDCVGVALIAGTGSCAFGRSADGNSKRHGGWGYLLGDEGSGYAIGRAALQVAIRVLEGEGASSSLTEQVLAHLGARSVEDVTRAVYGSDSPRNTIADLAPLVLTADDPAARLILSVAAAELASLVVRTARSVGLAGSVFSLAVSGGVVANSESIRSMIQSELRSQGLDFKWFFVPDPLVGCIRLADPRIGEQLLSWHAT